MSIVETETREAESPWRSKVDDRGQPHVYSKIAAAELKVGDHLLEHITGHRRQVATPVLAVRHTPDGIIVTIPDRHSDNNPVQELYPPDRPVFISKTPHLEQHNPADNLFAMMEKKELDMEQQAYRTLEQARAGMQAAQGNIDKGVESLILTQDAGRAKTASRAVQSGAVDLSNHVLLGADAVAEAMLLENEYTQWMGALDDSAQFTAHRSKRLTEYAKAVENPECREHAAYARGALDMATQVALDKRRQCVLDCMQRGPLAEFALADAERIGMLAELKPEEVGLLLAKISPAEVVLGRADGHLVVLPALPFDAETGTPVRMVADEIGVYHVVMEKEKGMEKQIEKQQYPRMEAHLKSPDNTWHSASLYIDKEGQPRGVIAVENREQGIAEKHSVQFTEKVSEKTGEKFLTAKAEREDGKVLYVNIVPHEKGGERFLSASFAERDLSKEKGQQLSPITGTGGTLKPNAALLEKSDKDRTAQYVRETLKVDPAREVGKSKDKGLQPAKEVSR